MQTYRLTTEVFCLPHLGRHIAYAPLKNVVLLVNDAAANLLWELDQGALSAVDETNIEILSTLIDLQLVNGPPDEIHEDGDGEFRPTEATLFLTTTCNLRCVYCYASGGDTDETMSRDAAGAAVDFVAENARAIGAGSFGISFHGGGEPTVAWDLMKQVAAYAKKQAADQKLECRLALATNGVLAEGRADWIAAEMDNINVSVDGTEAVQDRQRPLRGGGPSFPHVMRTIRALSDRKKAFGLRMTVTKANLPHVPEAVRFFCRNSTPNVIHAEPVFQCGRCAAENIAGPTGDEFVSMFREARSIAEEHGVRLYYSGARYPELSPVFCQAAGRSFTVTTQGRVTACYEVSKEDDPRADTFFYGRYDAELRRFVFDTAKLDRLREFNIHNLPFCERCFCKYHCAGDCPAKRMLSFEQGIPDTASDRCTIAQELTRDQIVATLERGSKTVRMVAREYSLSKEVNAGG